MESGVLRDVRARSSPFLHPRDRLPRTRSHLSPVLTESSEERCARIQVAALITSSVRVAPRTRSVEFFQPIKETFLHLLVLLELPLE